MPDRVIFPSLDGFEPTRQTLQLYSRAVGVIPRAHGDFHPKWWHISLKVEPNGLITDEMIGADGGVLRLMMDLTEHKVVFLLNGKPVQEISMLEGKSATAFGETLLAIAAELLGLSGDYAREKFRNDEPRQYDPDMAETYLIALVNAERLFQAHRATLSGEVSPIQLWPHGFDLAFEWYGTRIQMYEEEGEMGEHPSQLNLGFYPGNTDDAYFYSNPWPFDAEALLSQELPDGAKWYNESWKGSVFPYAELVGDARAEERLRGYARAVYDIASPTLMAE
jgi:hypothetical protein